MGDLPNPSNPIRNPSQNGDVSASVMAGPLNVLVNGTLIINLRSLTISMICIPIRFCSVPRVE